MSGHRSGSRKMYARSVTVLAGGRADNVRPCVPKWRFRASAIRRGSVERPRENSPRPCAESDLDTMHRYAVFQDALSDGASVEVLLRDAIDRRWLAGPAPALPSTAATTIVTTAKADGQLRESADASARGRRAGGAGHASRAGGLSELPGLPWPKKPPWSRRASAVECRAATPTSRFLPDGILASHSGVEKQKRTQRAKSINTISEFSRSRSNTI